MPHRLFFSLIMLFSLHAFAGDDDNSQPRSASDSTPDSTQSTKGKSSEKKPDDRGFDPCLLNANLPVCKNK